MSDKLKRALAVCAVILFGAVNVGNFNHEGDLHLETYTVKSGDTFWAVTQIYRDKDARNLYIFDYQDEVRKLNPELVKKHCQLNPGDVITLQYAESRSTDD